MTSRMLLRGWCNFCDFNIQSSFECFYCTVMLCLIQWNEDVQRITCFSPLTHLMSVESRSYYIYMASSCVSSKHNPQPVSHVLAAEKCRETAQCPIAAVAGWEATVQPEPTALTHISPPLCSAPCCLTEDLLLEMEESRHKLQNKPVRVIAAICNNMGIGKDGALPWSLP